MGVAHEPYTRPLQGAGTVPGQQPLMAADRMLGTAMPAALPQCKGCGVDQSPIPYPQSLNPTPSLRASCVAQGALLGSQKGLEGPLGPLISAAPRPQARGSRTCRPCWGSTLSPCLDWEPGKCFNSLTDSRASSGLGSDRQSWAWPQQKRR